MTVQPKRRSFDHFAFTKVLSSLLVLVLLSPPVPTVSQSTLPGCHPPFSPSETYSPSSLVSVDSVNYQCVDTAYSLYCSGAANAPPGAPGSFASVAWTNLGPCDAAAPTTSSSSVPSDSPSGSPSESPSDDRGEYLGACPRPYDTSVVYSAGDVVSVQNDDDDDADPFSSVHRCKSWPYSSFCPIYNFRPGTPNGSLGWTLVGWCDNSISASPTITPTWAPHTPGCPAPYVPGRVYDAGDRVAYDPDEAASSSSASPGDTIYECSPIYSLHCPYRPPEIVAGEEAWVNLGKCRGTIAPTAGPTESWPTWSPTVEFGRFVSGGGGGSGGEVELEGSLHLVLFEEKDPSEGGGRRRRLDEVDLDMDVVVLNYLQDNIGGEFTFETISVQSTEQDTFELLVDPRNATMDEVLVVANVWKMNLAFSMTEGFRNWIVDYHDGNSNRRRRELGVFLEDQDEDEDVGDEEEYQEEEGEEDEEEAGYEFQGDDGEHPNEYEDEDGSHGIVFSSRRLADACSPSDYTMCCSSKSLSSKESDYCKKVGCSSRGCKRKLSTKIKKKKKRRNKKNRHLQQQQPLQQQQQQQQQQSSRRHLEDTIKRDLWGLNFLDVVRNYTRYDPTDVFALLNATDTTDVAVCGANRYVELAEIQDPYFSCDVYESNDCSNNEDVVLENTNDDDDNNDPNSVCSPGCPPEYVPGTPYDEGDRVAIDGIRAYECTSPFHLFCRQFGPEDPGGSPAWIDLGSCTGTIAPTSPPTFSPDTPGCPDPYDPTGATAYRSGDRVSVDGNRAYACKSGNYQAFCNAGSIYAPGGPYSNLGWDDLGSCQGTVDPTLAPTVDPLAPVCPPEYSPSTAYQGGDEVAAKGIAYMCKMDAYSAFCNAGPMYAPGGTYSNLGWERLGSCRYSSESPTLSPTVPSPVVPPSSSPSSFPTSLPPTLSPTVPPTPLDSAYPSLSPSSGPSSYPSGLPSEFPTLPPV